MADDDGDIGGYAEISVACDQCFRNVRRVTEGKKLFTSDQAHLLMLPQLLRQMASQSALQLSRLTFPISK